MKKQLYRFILAASLLSTGMAAVAQEEEPTPRPTTPRWVSGKGYWVVESNIHIPRQYTVRFYNNDQLLVYKEQLQGVQLKLERRKVKMNLKRVLEAAVLAWEKQRQVKENEGWVTAALH